jgi:hypothetical protein
MRLHQDLLEGSPALGRHACGGYRVFDSTSAYAIRGPARAALLRAYLAPAPTGGIDRKPTYTDPGGSYSYGETGSSNCLYQRVFDSTSACVIRGPARTALLRAYVGPAPTGGD